jgi:hypothetical protein
MQNILLKKRVEILKNTKDSDGIVHLLSSFTGLHLKSPSVIKIYHDLLLFYCAYPMNQQILLLARKELGRIVLAVKKIFNTNNLPYQNSLMSSGIANSAVLSSFSFPIVCWLKKKFDDSAELYSCDADEETNLNTLQILLPAAEFEKISQGELEIMKRLKQISGISSNAQLLKWLLSLFQKNSLHGNIKEELFRQFKIYIYWQLSDELFSRSFLQIPVKNIYFQEKISKNINLISIINKPVPRNQKLTYAEKINIIDSMKASLALQYRETDPVTYADPGELTLFDCEKGLKIALIGMTASKRLSLESYIGYMVYKNGLPVAYGGGWIWGNQCRIGINIYSPFRRGESAFIFSQVLRFYYQYFNVQHFIVKPYQFGEGNPEGIKSGAFWFYYKLGFRPVLKDLKKEAGEEWKKIQRNKEYRTTSKLLKHFTKSSLELKLENLHSFTCDPYRVSAAITKLINDIYKGNRQKAVHNCLKRLSGVFYSIPGIKQLPAESVVLKNWGLVTGLIPDLEQWTSGEKKSLLSIFRAKQSGPERQFIILLQNHKRFWHSLSASTQ